MNTKRMLFIINPCAGQRRVARKLADILQRFCAGGMVPTVLTTEYAGHARKLVQQYAGQHDIVVCAGGDGTLNETVAGLLESGADIPIGYLPCGTTNDLASTLGLSRDLDQAAQDIASLVESMGGYFEQKNFSNYSSSYRHASYTVRVPAEQFTDFCTQVGTLCHVTWQSDTAENISERYYDTQSRLETAQIKLERLQELLSKADNMADIITIESAISDTEYEIESLSGTLRHYDALVDYATVSLTLSETYKLDENEGAPLTFGARIARAFTNGLRDTGVFLEDLAIGIANNLVFLAVLAALAVVVVRAVRKKKPLGRLGKKKSKLPAGEEPKSEE